MLPGASRASDLGREFYALVHVFALTLAGFLAGAICCAALLVRRRRGARLMRPELALALINQDGGLNALRLHSGRDRWWDDAADSDLERVEQALSTYDLLAWCVARGTVDRRVVLAACRDRIVELWEQAYPYVLDRRRISPELWSSLAELYVDAHGASARSGRVTARLPDAVRRPPREHRSVSPDEIPVAVPPPLPDPTPLLDLPPLPDPTPLLDPAPAASVRSTAPAPVDPYAPQWAEALRRALGDAPGPAVIVPSPVEQAPRAPAASVSEDVETRGHSRSGRASAAAARPGLVTDHVIDLVFGPGQAGARDAEGLHSR